jgi:UDP-glucose 4-epimerase
MKKTILVTGGAGYIGSHTVVELLNRDYDVIILDNFSNSKIGIIGRISKITEKEFTFFGNNCCDDLHHIFSKHKIDGVIHFAALKSVGESVERPIEYYENNINSLLNVLKYCKEYEVKSFIFSSSCSLYGNLKELPANEESELSEPESPYAYTKLVGERILKDFSKNVDIKIISLRYFNPVGAHYSGLIGELPLNKPNNILPVICNSVDTGEPIYVFGNDYDTPDGTCIRDYIHVSDIANAHVLAYEYSESMPNKSEVFNLGSGEGVSVLELIKTFASENEIDLNFEFSDRRTGDVEKIYSDSSKAKAILNWEPKRSVNEMVNSAWKWHKKRV